MNFILIIKLILYNFPAPSLILACITLESGGTPGHPVTVASYEAARHAASTFTFDGAAGAWSLEQPWSGIPARVGATVALREKDGATWLFGGSRTAQSQPLQDVWRLEEDGSWISVVPPLSPVATGADCGPLGQSRGEDEVKIPPLCLLSLPVSLSLLFWLCLCHGMGLGV